jgi:hypothetical protein
LGGVKNQDTGVRFETYSMIVPAASNP